MIGPLPGDGLSVYRGLIVGQGGCMADAEQNRLLNLKVAKDRKSLAQNKPLLVMAILDLVEAGLVPHHINRVRPY